MGGVLTVSDVITRVQRTFGDESGVQVTTDDIIRWINDAQREAVMQNEGLILTTGFIDTVAGQNEYTLPTDCFTLTEVKVKDADQNSYYKLFPASLREMDELADGWEGSGQQNYPTVYTKEQSSKFTVYPAPLTSVAQGIKLIYSRYANDVTSQSDPIDLPPYLHSYVVNFCLMQAYEMDEDWESAQQKASQIQGDLDFNNNRQFWFGRDAYQTISVNDEDLN